MTDDRSALRDASDARKATALERIEAVIAWIERGELLPGPGVGPDLEDWKTIAAALATLPGQTSALRDDQVRDALAEFTEYFARNYPGATGPRDPGAKRCDTLIHDPYWHAPKIFRAAEYAINRALAATRPAEPIEPGDHETAGLLA